MGSRIVTYNLIAKSLKDTFLLLSLALRGMRGTSVEVGPFDDSIVSRLYVWIRGTAGEVDLVLNRMDKEAKSRGIEFIKTPVVANRNRG